MIIREKLTGKVIGYDKCSEIYTKGANTYRTECPYDHYHEKADLLFAESYDFFYKYSNIKIEYIFKNERKEYLFTDLYYWKRIAVGEDIPIVFNKFTKKIEIVSF